MKRVAALLFLLSACASAPKPKPAPVLVEPPAPLLSAEAPGPETTLPPELIAKAEGLRAEGMEMLYSKDPSVKDPARALEKFHAAAEIGDPVSMDHIGGFYAVGMAGVPKSCPKALEWFEKSAAAGYPPAVNNLAYTLVTCPEKKLRDPERAETLVKFLFQGNPGYLALLDTYAALLAEQRNFKQAAKTLEVVIDLSSLADANPERIDEMKSTLKRYRAGKKAL